MSPTLIIMLLLIIAALLSFKFLFGILKKFAVVVIVVSALALIAFWYTGQDPFALGTSVGAAVDNIQNTVSQLNESIPVLPSL